MRNTYITFIVVTKQNKRRDRDIQRKLLNKLKMELDRFPIKLSNTSIWLRGSELGICCEIAEHTISDVLKANILKYMRDCSDDVYVDLEELYEYGIRISTEHQGTPVAQDRLGDLQLVGDVKYIKVDETVEMYLIYT